MMVGAFVCCNGVLGRAAQGTCGAHVSWSRWTTREVRRRSADNFSDLCHGL